MGNKWSTEELSTLEEMAESYTVKQIEYRLKRRGYHRTIFAITQKLQSLGYSTRPILDNYSCSEIARNLCLHSSTLTRWARRGLLKAQKRSVSCYQVRKEDLKQFIDNPPQSLKKRIDALDPQILSYLVG